VAAVSLVFCAGIGFAISALATPPSAALSPLWPAEVPWSSTATAFTF
jgi:hypothetical protein